MRGMECLPYTKCCHGMSRHRHMPDLAASSLVRKGANRVVWGQWGGLPRGLEGVPREGSTLGVSTARCAGLLRQLLGGCSGCVLLRSASQGLSVDACALGGSCLLAASQAVGQAGEH